MLRVTGAQGMSRAGLTEHTIALLARWGSAAVLTHIRKAPLTASRYLAAVARAGWERGAAPTRTVATFADSSVAPAAVTQRTEAVGPSSPSQAEHRELVRDVRAL